MDKTLEDDLEKFVLDGQHIVSIWLSKNLWDDEAHAGLCVFENGKWTTVTQGLMYEITVSPTHVTEDELVAADAAWQEALDRIKNGNAKPFWTRRKCSCGAEAVYGKNCPGHSPLCMINDTSYYGPNVPKNNDGRKTCFKCGKPTIDQSYWCRIYNLCDNPECEWFEK